MIRIITICLLGFMGCGSSGLESQMPRRVVNPLLMSYLNEYVNEMAKRGIPTNVPVLRQLIIVPDGTIDKFMGSAGHEALCTIQTVYGNGPDGKLTRDNYTTIQIEREYANNKWTIFHEFGHCLHGMEHYDIGLDIMNTVVPVFPLDPLPYLDVLAQRIIKEKVKQ